MRNLNNNFLKIDRMLCKNIIIRSCKGTFQCQSYCTYHCNQQKQTCQNQEVWMNSIQGNSLICNWGCRCSQTTPKRIRKIHSFFFPRSCFRKRRREGSYMGGKRLPQSLKSLQSLTKKENTCNRVSSTLMRQNFSRRNIQKHNNKKKLNSQSTNINQQLKQYKIFEPQKHLQTRTVQKQQNQIKNRVHGVFRTSHLKNTCQCTSCNLSKRGSHFFTKHLSLTGFEPITFELKARCSAN